SGAGFPGPVRMAIRYRPRRLSPVAADSRGLWLAKLRTGVAVAFARDRGGVGGSFFNRRESPGGGEDLPRGPEEPGRVRGCTPSDRRYDRTSASLAFACHVVASIRPAWPGSNL